jgi:hypothetical protein
MPCKLAGKTLKDQYIFQGYPSGRKKSFGGQSLKKGSEPGY